MAEATKPKLLSAADIAKKLQAMYASKKKDSSKISTGMDIAPPPFFVKASPPLAKIMGVPGYAGQRVVEISGKPNSGKTTALMEALVEAQRAGFYALLGETEKKFSENRFKRMGGNPEQLMVVNASTLEQLFDGLNGYLEVIYASDPDATVFVGIDSIGGTPSAKEAEADAEDTLQLAIAAKVIKRNMRTFVTRWLDTKNVSLLVINQNYANIGSHGRSNSGGDGLEYAAALIIQLSRVSDLTKTVKGEKVKFGIVTKAKVTKNHLMQGDYTIDNMEFAVTALGIDFVDNVKGKKKNAKGEDEEVEVEEVEE